MKSPKSVFEVASYVAGYLIIVNLLQSAVVIMIGIVLLACIATPAYMWSWANMCSKKNKWLKLFPGMEEAKKRIISDPGVVGGLLYAATFAALVVSAAIICIAAGNIILFPQETMQNSPPVIQKILLQIGTLKESLLPELLTI